MMRHIVLAAIALLISTAAIAADLAGTARVIDGETISSCQASASGYGASTLPSASSDARARTGAPTNAAGTPPTVLSELTRGRQVQCRERDRDRYQRIVAVCGTEVGELNAAMVRRGWAIDFTRYSAGYYGREEVAAKREGLGLWSGRFEMPWEWRRERR